MRKRFLLVNPWISDFAAFDFWLKPLGLLRIAGALRQADCEVHLLDLVDRNHPWLPERTKTDAWGRGKFHAEEIDKPDVCAGIPRKFTRYGVPRRTVAERLCELPDADAVLVTSGMTYWYAGIRETIELLRHRYPDTLFILGGIYATLMPEHARDHSGADIVVPGALESRQGELESLLGVITPRAPYRPAWDLYENLDYVVMTISRGCPFRCTYCASRLLDDGFVPRPLEEVLTELEFIRSLGVTRIAFYDDALLFHPRFNELMQGIIDRDLGLELHTPNGLHVNRIDPDKAALMYKAGFRSLYLSLETVDENLLSSTGAKLSLSDFSNAVTALKDAGFPPDAFHAYVLFGLPGQTEDSVRKTIDLALSEYVTPHLAEFSPVPGTTEYSRAGLDYDTDPLLSNNTYWCTRPDLDESLERLKAYIQLSRRK